MIYVLFIGFEQEFELLYYQRHTERIHFVRQSIHALLHYAREILRVGPPICCSQWTMEWSIGYYVAQINQPSNPYANLTQRMTRNAQLNAMCVLYPHLKLQGRPEYRVPRGAKDMGDGPSTLPTPQDNISEQLEYSLPAPSQAVLQDTLQPTHIPEHDSERLVDVSVTDLAVVTVRPTEEAPGTAESTSVMRPNKASKTARNLCALEWCAEMKQKKLKPLTKEFEAYWNKLKECPDQLKIWNEKSTALMSGKGQ
ncbi:hypothetical protein F4604DRAFT_1671068 [Suillus subluteus]|nr:hypothetical protein F4604DRAFT_1671068 [Suillus subluteus]